MASLRGFSETRAASSTSKSDTNPAPLTDLADFALAGIIGSQLSEPLSDMQHVLNEFSRTRKITSDNMRQLKKSLDLARTVAKQSQQIARLASGRLRQSHERLKLDLLLGNALRDRADDFHHKGVELYQNLKAVEVIVDPSLLFSLIDAALDWAVSMGRRLVITLEIKNWPEYGMLFIKTSDSVAAGNDEEDGTGSENLGWYLLSETARAMGVSVEKVSSAHEVSLLIEFPRTVKRLEGMTAVEMDTGFDSLHSESKPLAGHRVLVITNDEKLRMEVTSIARTMSLVVDFAPSTSQGMRFCEMETPHMLIIDERVRDHVFDELRMELRKMDGNFPFIEVANDSNVLEVAGWMSDSMTRLSRDALRSQLPSIMALELSKVM
ncbi:MAG: hypothetical protein V4772_23985 [Pseudomonadota bacterium]